MKKIIEEDEDFKNFNLDASITSSEHSESSKNTISTETTVASRNHQQITVNHPTEHSIQKRLSTKKKKNSLEEYRLYLLVAPKIIDRRTVFISNALRVRIVEIVRKLGYEKSSVSGFIENLVRHHLELYHEDVESWKKL